MQIWLAVARLADVAAFVRDDEVAAQLGGSVLYHKLQLEFAFVFNALQIQGRRETLEHLADSSLRNPLSITKWTTN